jgi:uncharacterized repeat protein (TIGR02543 family)
MAQFDDQLPEDLRDIAARLHAARVTPTELELDELRRRVHGRARRAPQRRSLAGALRVKGVAALLTMGLMLTTGAGVVFATGSFGTGGSSNPFGDDPFGNVFQSTSFRHGGDASFCQYHGAKVYDYTFWDGHRYVKILLVWECGHLIVHIDGRDPFGFRWGDGHWFDTGSGSWDSSSPNPDDPFTITTGGWTWTWTGDGTPPNGGATPTPNSTVIFVANGGTGSTASETGNAPMALTANGFTRTGYTFAGWNTALDGTGTAYGDGALYSFASSTVLYAQWTANPANTPPPTSSSSSSTTTTTTTTSSSNSAPVTSSSTSTSSSKTSSSTTSSTTTSSTTTSSGTSSGTGSKGHHHPRYYHHVSFDANGGAGGMGTETHSIPSTLYPSSFFRPGYTFAGWSTSPTGGVAYGNGAVFSFTSNATLYAHWTKHSSGKRHHTRG